MLDVYAFKAILVGGRLEGERIPGLSLGATGPELWTTAALEVRREAEKEAVNAPH